MNIPLSKNNFIQSQSTNNEEEAFKKLEKEIRREIKANKIKGGKVSKSLRKLKVSGV